MCGRFEGYFPEGKLESPFDDIKWTYEQDDEKLKIHDIRPTNKIKCSYRDNDEFIVANVNWGIKFHNKDLEKKYLSIYLRIFPITLNF